MKLKTWLYLHRLKITELARLLGVSRCYVHQIFSGAKPSQALLDRVSVITHGNVTKFEELKEDE